jgi:hypothetical protein
MLAQTARPSFRSSPTDQDTMRRALHLVLACAATVGCGNGALAPTPESGTAPMIAPDGGPDASDRVPEAASSDQTAAPDVSDAAWSDQSTAPDNAASPEAGAADVPPGRVPYRAIALSVGEVHVCVILDDHKVKCWGDNSSGQLGLGDMKSRGSSPSEMGDALPTVDLGTGRTAKAVVARNYSTCAILDDDTLKCWGTSIFSDVFTAIGDQPGEMGDHLAPIDLGASRKPTSVVLGRGVSCATADDGAVLCSPGAARPTPVMLRPGVTVAALAAGYEVVALYSDGSIWSVWEDMPRKLHFTLDAGTQARALFAMFSNYCATLDTGGLKCWKADLGDLPPAIPAPTTSTDVASLAFTQNVTTCWLTTSHEVNCAASNPPNPVPLGRPAVAIDGGGQASVCALLDDASVKCWGWGANPDHPWLGGGYPDAQGWSAVNLGRRTAP